MLSKFSCLVDSSNHRALKNFVNIVRKFWELMHSIRFFISGLILEGVYMRPEMKFTRNDISFWHEKKFCSHYFSLRVKWNRKFLFESSDLSFFLSNIRRRKCFLSEDSFRGSVYKTFITRNENSYLSKWLQWNNNRNEFHFGLFHVNSYETNQTPNWKYFNSPEMKSHI